MSKINENIAKLNDIIEHLQKNEYVFADEKATYIFKQAVAIMTHCKRAGTSKFGYGVDGNYVAEKAHKILDEIKPTWTTSDAERNENVARITGSARKDALNLIGEIRMSKKQELIQPKGRYDYLSDSDGVVFLIDNEAKTVKRIPALTRQKLVRNRIAHLHTVFEVTNYFGRRGFVLFNVKRDDGAWVMEFSFEEHKFSETQVICDICQKFSVSADNISQQVNHARHHYFGNRGWSMSQEELTKFYKVIPEVSA